MNWLKKNKNKEKLQNILPEILFRTGVSTHRKFICQNIIKNYTILDLESTKINCNIHVTLKFILYVFSWFWLLNIITWIISMLKIQHVPEMKKCLCVPKAQITFIRCYVNRYTLKKEFDDTDIIVVPWPLEIYRKPRFACISSACICIPNIWITIVAIFLVDCQIYFVELLKNNQLYSYGW